MSENIAKLEKKLNYKFKNKKLLIEALTHKSYKQFYDNERLEFLGDAVLDLIVGEYLYKKFSTSAEGNLSKIRASLVNEAGFNKLAIFLGLGEFILMSKAEESNKGREKPSLLSNSFEAVIGAIYLDSSLEVVQKISIELIEANYKDISLNSLSNDYKTVLQEITQARYGETPKYVVVSSSGPDHLKEFEIAVFIEDKEIARAKGKSKKIAQQESAKIALKIIDKA